MRQYYLCNPDDQAISGPHPFSDLIQKAIAGEITPEWFVAEPGSEQFTAFTDSFSLHEILFCGGIVPVEPPPVASVKLRGGPAPVATPEGDFPSANADHNAEYAKVVAKSGFSLGKPGSHRKHDGPPRMKFTSPNENLTPENILHMAREDLARVLKKHDDDHFNPPTYWKSPAGERMHHFLYGTGCILIFCFSMTIFFSFIGGLDLQTLFGIGFLGLMLIASLALIVFFLMS